MTEAAKRFLSLDVVRGLAAIAVFITHWCGITATPEQQQLFIDRVMWVLRRGIDVIWHGGGIHPGVIIFIVLSGYCIHLPLARDRGRLASPRFWRVYLIRRLVRIAPVYWFAALLGVVVLIIGERSGSGLDSHTGELTASGLLSTFTLLTSVVRPLGLEHNYHPGNGPLYTVAVEILLYLSYPAVIVLYLKRGPIPVLAIALLLYGVQVIPRALWGSSEALNGNYFEFVLYWIIGAAAAESYYRDGGDKRLKRGIGLLTALAATFFLYSYLVVIPGAHVGKTVLLALTTGALLYTIMIVEARAGDGSSRLWTALGIVGQRSYSLYAVHTPIILATLYLFAVMGAGSSPWMRWSGFFAVMIGTELVYRLVERPSHRLTQRIAQRYST